MGMNEKETFTPAELAERWGCTTGHLSNLRGSGEGCIFAKLGGLIVYLRKDVEAYENANRWSARSVKAKEVEA